VRTFWKSRFAIGASYFGSAETWWEVDVVSHALKQSAQIAAQRRRKKLRLRNGGLLTVIHNPMQGIFSGQNFAGPPDDCVVINFVHPPVIWLS
jgi:hypothetical protein